MGKTTTYKTVAGLNRTLRKLPKEASRELRAESKAIARKVATAAASRARTQPGVAKYVAPTIKARSDRVPVVVMGGSTRLPGHTGQNQTHQTVGDVWAGAEFGSRRYTQFQPWTGNQHVGKPGYFLYNTIRENETEIMGDYSDALYRAMKKV